MAGRLPTAEEIGRARLHRPLRLCRAGADRSPYDRWREYNPEDTIRFFALRLHEIGMIRSSPQKIIAGGTDWRFLNELKRELKAKRSKKGGSENVTNIYATPAPEGALRSRRGLHHRRAAGVAAAEALETTTVRLVNSASNRSGENSMHPGQTFSPPKRRREHGHSSIDSRTTLFGHPPYLPEMKSKSALSHRDLWRLSRFSCEPEHKVLKR
jgi:hypothetical protein